ncbi:MAG TPA: O-antigen ligase family protein [Gaiellaceae bacterium]|nr:O-antigen ligase family protein [Gaiellaceae bacterium]
MAAVSHAPRPGLLRSHATLVAGAVVLVSAVGVAAGLSHGPLLIAAGVAGAAYLLLAITAPLPAVVLFFLLTFISQLSVVSGGVSVAKGAGGALVLGWVYREISGRGDRSAFSTNRAFVVFSAAFLVWCLASTLWASDSGAAFSSSARIAQGPLLVIALVGLAKDERAVHVLCGTFLAGATLSAAVGLSGVTRPDTVAVASADNRLTGGIGDPNYLAAVLVPAVALALFMSQAPRRPGTRVPILLAGTVCLVALFLTQSRGGIVALAVTVVVGIAFAGRARRNIVVAASGVLAVASIYLMLVAPPHALGRITQFTSGGGTGRTDLWTVALKSFEGSPVQGIGLGNFVVVEPTLVVDVNTDLPRADLVVTQRQPVHNTYLHIAAELGLVGIVLFLAALGAVVVAARDGVRALVGAGNYPLELVGRGLVVGCLGMLTAFTFLTAQYEKQLWLTLGLVLAYARVARSRAGDTITPPAVADGPRRPV